MLQSMFDALKKNLALSAGFFYALVFSCCFLTACTGSTKKTQKDSVVVIQIENHKLTLKQLLKKSQSFPSQIFNQKYQSQLSEFTKKRIIKQFLENYLLKKWAKEKNIVVTSSKVQKYLKKLMRGYSDKISFKQSLYENNVSEKQLTAFVRSMLLRKEWVKLHKKLVRISKKDIALFLNKKKRHLKPVKTVVLQHLLLKTETDAEIIRSFLVKNKMSFFNLYNILPKFNPILAQRKIKVPYGASSVFDPAFKMKVGEISPIVKSSWGWHIYKVLKLQKNKKGLSKPYSFIKAILIEKKIDNLYQDWIQKQLKNKTLLVNKALLKQL
ncbi:MAG: hypothetical protein HAW63_00220 [Bdellovibrionaceae bacterium]|nr:hypothetical protein [Pseudobdellovibrionaceae bacterium]